MPHLLIASPLSRRATTAIGVILAALTLAVTLLPGRAQASASGCVNSQNPPRSCVSVFGAGTWVDSIKGAVILWPRQSDRGYIRVWGSGFAYDSPVVTRWNQSYINGHQYWSPDFAINRNLPDGSKVCAAWHSDVAHHWRNAACETIHA
jgi:hypothetical protein